MGANNWDYCPQCMMRNQEAKRQIDLDLGKKYGKVSSDKYHELSARADKQRTELDKKSQDLREDWEIGVNTLGQFTVDYACSCSHCGFKFAFKRTEQVPLTVGKKAQA